MKKLIVISLIISLFTISSSAENTDNVSKWISKYNSLSNDKKLIFCIPVYEIQKGGAIDLVHSIIVSDKEKSEISKNMIGMLVKTFDNLYLHETVAYLSMTKDLQSYLKGKNLLKDKKVKLVISPFQITKLTYYQNWELYSDKNSLPSENVILVSTSEDLLYDSRVSVTQNQLLEKCTENYLLLTKENERIKEIIKDISTDEFKKILFYVTEEEWVKRLELKVNKSKQ